MGASARARLEGEPRRSVDEASRWDLRRLVAAAAANSEVEVGSAEVGSCALPKPAVAGQTLAHD